MTTPSPRLHTRRPSQSHSAVPALLAVALALGVSAAARAHNKECVHTHDLGDDVITCDELEADCGDDGYCNNRQNRWRGWCACVEDDTGNLFGLGRNAFDAATFGPPLEGEVIVYTAVLDPENLWDVVDRAGASVAEYGPGGAELTGTVTIAYGPFDDPAAAVATLADVSLTLPAWVVGGASTGTNTIRLIPGDSHALVYDIGASRLDTASPAGIVAELDNAFGAALPLHLAFEGHLDPAGRLSVLVEGRVTLPCAADIDGSGDVGFSDVLAVLSAWGPCLACAEDVDHSGLVGFGDLLMVLSTWGPCP